MSTIYILNSDGQQQAYDENQIHDWLDQGLLMRETLFWKEGMPEWRPLQELPPRMVAVAPPVRPISRTGLYQQPPAQAPAAAQPLLAPTRPARRSRVTDKHDDYDGYRFRFMPKVRLLRMLAAGIDLLLVLAPFIVIFLLSPFFFSHDTDESQPSVFVFSFVGLYWIGLILIQVIMAFMGRSIGKDFFRLRVVDVDTDQKRGFVSYLVRLVTHGSFGLVPSCLFAHLPTDILGGAILYALIDASVVFYEDRCLHDYLAGTHVIKRGPY